MLVLSKSDMQKVFPMKEAIVASKEALSLYSSGKTIIPLRTVLNVQDNNGTTLFMPAHVDSLNTTGIKIVSVYPNNISKNKPAILAKMLLLDATTGEVVAIMDGTYLTQLRTGALQGAATDILSKKNSKIAALFGSGGQARTQLEALLNVRTLDEIRIFSLDFEKSQKFAQEMQNEFGNFHTKIIAVKDSHSAIENADIIITATTSKKPVFNAEFVKQGAHINGIGSYTHEMQELPENILIKADKIFFDTNEGVLSEAGDIIIPLQSGALKETNLDGELGEILLGNTKGRETEEEITVFKSVGSAVFDIVTAYKIYQKAISAKIGNNIEI